MGHAGITISAGAWLMLGQSPSTSPLIAELAEGKRKLAKEQIRTLGFTLKECSSLRLMSTARKCGRRSIPAGFETNAALRTQQSQSDDSRYGREDGHLRRLSLWFGSLTATHSEIGA
jgi:hypothetical protein